MRNLPYLVNSYRNFNNESKNAMPRENGKVSPLKAKMRIKTIISAILASVSPTYFQPILPWWVPKQDAREPRAARFIMQAGYEVGWYVRCRRHTNSSL